MKVAVSGATGLVGGALCESFRENDVEILAITRGGRSLPSYIKPVPWSPSNGDLDADLLEGTDVVVHLAGESIANRWTRSHKERIRSSRVEGTRHLVNGLRRLDKPPSLLISASAVGFYGNRGDEELDESSPPGSGFLPEVCQAWESEAARASDTGIRAVSLRIGVVLSSRGGALGQMLLPFKMGMGGPLGSGKQWLSWIHIEDVVGAIRFLMDQPESAGAFNATAPEPVRQADFAKALGKALHRPAFLPAPAHVLRLVLGEMSQLLLEGQKVHPQRLVNMGYKFKHPTLLPALKHVISEKI
jgi:uncharacterized protein (TIGR01777 family)